MKIKRLQAISIIEVLIAGGILAMILGASVALSRTVTKNQLITQDRTMANSLASEALEQIQALNDTTKIDGVVNDFKSLLPEACRNNLNPSTPECQNIELSWLGSPDDTVYLEKDNPPIPTNETDPNSDDEVIVVDLDPVSSAAGIISDNIYRMKDLSGQKTTESCSTSSVQKIIYCRKISVSPIVINVAQEADPIYNPGDNSVLPKITEEDSSEIAPADSDKYTFEALATNAFKVTAEVTWLEFGKLKSVIQTDIITNW